MYVLKSIHLRTQEDSLTSWNSFYTLDHKFHQSRELQVEMDEIVK